MSRWYRVFCASDHVPTAAGIERCLAAAGTPVSAHLDADERGWYRAELVTDRGPVVLERWLAEEEGIRAELNSWAAVLEEGEDSPESRALMERIIQARQLLTLSGPEDLVLPLCRHLAGTTSGFYQADDAGFFAADGTLLVGET